jgi:acetylornithine deacetylase/succinyl-diaminopimelate desuccinylase-like protein
MRTTSLSRCSRTLCSLPGCTITDLSKGGVTNSLIRLRFRRQTKQASSSTAAHNASFLFVGHTDVVPVGEEREWRHDPFDAVVEDGYVWGRGTADMKGSVAAFAVAVERLYAALPEDAIPVLDDEEAERYAGLLSEIALLITSDEEGVAVDGVDHVGAAL